MSVTIESSQKTPVLAFHYGDEHIAFERTYRMSNAQRVLIKVHPDCSVLVHAPAAASDEDVLNAVKKRARWIYQQLRDFRAQLTHVVPRQYISGESYYYLGKQYMLKVTADPGAKQQVKLLRGKLEVTVRQKNPEKVRELLDMWYKSRAQEVFAKRLCAILEQALWVTEQPPLRLRIMKTQWGSCSPNGRLTLNPHLVKAPRECIDYVILHELCHIAEHNHSQRFYRLMRQVMPNWEKVKSRLDDMATMLLNGVC
ncbi:M48 family metallopeptidase [Zooshikella marina]|uniref:M48 family metallopeptidase n=1 Tax=Zooshikella ganghwensis TaxID=202772 RepID=UPI001BB01F8A|nr:SprT family zinc-dependent metalloprotease [Zooshikella ganghwensis]MBU2706339.1 M48 family metallopeptidase [Zooshikella ganghwensis]